MKITSDHQDRQVEVQQSRRLMLISIVYFVFLIIFVIKKSFIAVCYKPNLTLPAVECIPEPSLSLSMLKVSWLFFTDFTSIINFAILIFSGSKFRKSFVELLKSTKKQLFCRKMSMSTADFLNAAERLSQQEPALALNQK